MSDLRIDPTQPDPLIGDLDPDENSPYSPPMPMIREIPIHAEYGCPVCDGHPSLGAARWPNPGTHDLERRDAWWTR